MLSTSFQLEPCVWFLSKLCAHFIEAADLAGKEFDYLVSGKEEVPGYTKLATFDGFDRVSLKKFSIPPVSIATKPQIYVHRLAESES